MRCAAASARLVADLQFFDYENLSRTAFVHALTGGGSMSVLTIKNLADAYFMGMGGSVVVVAVAFASTLANSSPGLSLWGGAHRKLVGSGRMLRRDLRGGESFNHL